MAGMAGAVGAARIKDTLVVLQVELFGQRRVAVEHGGVGVLGQHALLERVESLVLVAAVDELLVLTSPTDNNNNSTQRCNVDPTTQSTAKVI